MNIHESSEDYLEAILVLGAKNESVRSIDIAKHLGYSKPSVSRAMKLLRENGYIQTDNNGNIRLTPEGHAIAGRIYEKHQKLAVFLMRLGVREDTAFKDACKIEHDISEESFDAICSLADKLEQ